MTDLSLYATWTPPGHGYAMAPTGFFPTRITLSEAPSIDVDLCECFACHEDLPLDAFPRNRAQSTGHDYICKDCRNDRRRAKRAEERAAAGMRPRTRSRPTPGDAGPPKRSESAPPPPTPEPRPAKVRILPSPSGQPPATIVTISPVPRKRLKDRIAERRAAS